MLARSLITPAAARSSARQSMLRGGESQARRMVARRLSSTVHRGSLMSAVPPMLSSQLSVDIQKGDEAPLQARHIAKTPSFFRRASLAAVPREGQLGSVLAIGAPNALQTLQVRTWMGVSCILVEGNDARK